MEDTGVILLPVRPPRPGTGWKYGNDHIVCGRTAKMWPCYANNDRLRLPAYMYALLDVLVPARIRGLCHKFPARPFRTPGTE